jgi:hypothetical protein
LDGLEADLEGEMDAAQLNYANSPEPELGINQRGTKRIAARLTLDAAGLRAGTG